MNSVNLSGRLMRGPELHELPSGTPVCELRLAVDGMGRGRDVGYIDVSVFGRPGEAAARVLGKGWLVAVQGSLAYHEWVARDGSRRSAHRVVGDVEFLAAPRSNDADPTPVQCLDETVANDTDEIPF